MQKNKLYKYKNVSGLGVFEIIMAVAIMMIITPAVLKYSFKELFEVKYISIAKHLKKIEKSLLNYMSIEKQNWSAANSPGGISGNVKEKLVEAYGLNTDIPKELTDGMQVKYKVEEATPDTPVVYAILDMSKLGFDEMAFKQTLLYAGDNVGYKEDAQAYSITGAWSDSMDDNMTNLSGDRIVVIRVDDTNLEDEYQSQIYLYRNDQGGAEGNQMRVDFDLNGYSIRNFGLIDANNVLASDGGDVSEIKFNKGTILGPTKIATSLILKGEGIVELIGNGVIYTQLLEILDCKDCANGVFSALAKLIVPKAILEAAIDTSRAKIIVGGNGSGVSKLVSLAVVALQFPRLNMLNYKSTPLNIIPLGQGELNLDIPVSDITELKTDTITVKDGRIITRNQGLQVNFVVQDQDKVGVILFNGNNNKVILNNVGDDSSTLTYQLDDILNRFGASFYVLETKIEKFREEILENMSNN
jgi:hypothetical protein